jgi:hypothetical protein
MPRGCWLSVAIADLGGNIIILITCGCTAEGCRITLKIIDGEAGLLRAALLSLGVKVVDLRKTSDRG